MQFMVGTRMNLLTDLTDPPHTNDVPWEEKMRTLDFEDYGPRESTVDESPSRTLQNFVFRVVARVNLRHS